MVTDKKLPGYIPLYSPRGPGRQPVTLLLAEETFARLDECARKQDLPRGTLASRIIEKAFEDVSGS